MVHLTKSIPSLLTLGNLLMGFAAILMADNPLWGMVLICAGALFDITAGVALLMISGIYMFLSRR